MLRSALTILGAKAFNYQDNHHLQLATVTELIHIAFLFHDHLNNPLLFSKQLSEAAILVGDFICSRAIEMIVETNHIQITKLLSTTINTMSQGLLTKSLHYSNPDITEEIYIEMIHRTHLSLISASAQLGALLCHSKPEDIEYMAQFGLSLGLAYQLTKEMIHYQKDIAQGKLTFPLVYALNNATDYHANFIGDLIKNNKEGKPNKKILAIVYKAIEETQSLAYTQDYAKKQITLASHYLHKIPVLHYKPIFLQILDAIAKGINL